MVPTVSSLLIPVSSSRHFQSQRGFSTVFQPWRTIPLSFHLYYFCSELTPFIRALWNGHRKFKVIYQLLLSILLQDSRQCRVLQKIETNSCSDVNQ